jgi:hypothetical protein
VINISKKALETLVLNGRSKLQASTYTSGFAYSRMTSNKSKKKYVPLSAFEAEAKSPTATSTDASSTPKIPLNK